MSSGAVSEFFTRQQMPSIARLCADLPCAQPAVACCPTSAGTPSRAAHQAYHLRVISSIQIEILTWLRITYRYVFESWCA
jgi:hypothetical protein